MQNVNKRGNIAEFAEYVILKQFPYSLKEKP
jgi:hypothetical protein